MKPDLLLIGGATERMLDRMTAHFNVHGLSEIEDLDAWLRAHAETTTAIATNGHDGVKPEIMAALPNLRIISCYGVGYDAIDATEAARRGIIVTHTPNVLNEEVADTAILLMLATYRRLVRDDAYVRSGRWEKEGPAPLTRRAGGRTVGILGLGRIGQAIADKLAAFDATVVYHARSKKDVPYRFYGDLVDMARDVEVLICITPGGPGTRHIVNREVLDWLGPDGILINVSRGSVVDEAELVEALKDGRLGGAGLDVFENEPKVPEALREMDNVTLLPHVGSATVETRRAMGDLVTGNLAQFMADGTVQTPVPECAHLAP